MYYILPLCKHIKTKLLKKNYFRRSRRGVEARKHKQVHRGLRVAGFRA